MATWDEAKRLRNIKDHEFDFVGCEAVFDGPIVTWDDDRMAYGELRIDLLGWAARYRCAYAYTERADEPHIISLREAEKHEVRRFAKEISRWPRRVGSGHSRRTG